MEFVQYRDSRNPNPGFLSHLRHWLSSIEMRAGTKCIYLSSALEDDVITVGQEETLIYRVVLAPPREATLWGNLLHLENWQSKLSLRLRVLRKPYL